MNVVILSLHHSQLQTSLTSLKGLTVPFKVEIKAAKLGALVTNFWFLKGIN